MGRNRIIRGDGYLSRSGGCRTVIPDLSIRGALRLMLSGMDSTGPVSDIGRMLTADEVADLLSVSTRTVRRLASEGVITRVRVGHRTARYTPRSVLALVDPENDESPDGNRALVKDADAGGDNEPG
jgi:excisionase family DNA binding protein